MSRQRAARDPVNTYFLIFWASHKMTYENQKLLGGSGSETLRHSLSFLNNKKRDPWLFPARKHDVTLISVLKFVKNK